MKSKLLVTAHALLLLSIVSCGGPSLRSVMATTTGQRAAVVSLSINDYMGALQGWNSTRTSDLMGSRAMTMLTAAEGIVGQHWQIVPAASFVGNPEWAQLATQYEVAVPQVGNVAMPTFAPDRGSLVGARLTPIQAQTLARISGANVLVVIYTEWGAISGGFIPTSKALTKTVVGIYDANGVELFHGRRDARGERTLGAFGHVVVDDGSIDEWVNAFTSSLATMFEQG